MDLSYLGPPARLAGEDANGDDALMARIATLKPQDALEEIYTRDVVDLTWEIFRLRRLKAALMQANAYREIEMFLALCEARPPRWGQCMGNSAAMGVRRQRCARGRQEGA